MATEKTAEQPSTKHDEDYQAQPLQSCIRSIKQLWNDRSDESISKYAEFTSACLAFMYHLKLDQERLFAVANRTVCDVEGTQSGDPSTPQQDEIPAIASLLNDGVLFQTFLSMLISKPLDDSDSAVNPLISGNNTSSSSLHPIQSNQPVKKSKIQSMNHHTMSNTRMRGPISKISENAEASMTSLSSSQNSFSSEAQQNHSMQQKLSKSQLGHKQLISNSRKRTLSYDLEKNTPKKMPKNLYSPKPNLVSDVKKTTPLLHMPLPPLPTLATETKHLACNYSPVLAASIFFSAFRHLDHWPPVFLQAFAADSFGPRQWVDDEKCALFVKNLLTALNPEPTVSNNDNATMVNTFSEGYERLQVSNSLHQDGTRLSFNSEIEKRHHENENSSDSDSGEEECVMEVSTGEVMNHTIAKPKQMKSSLNVKQNLSDSSSGDEEEMEEVIVSNAGISKPTMKKPMLKRGIKNDISKPGASTSFEHQASLEQYKESTNATCWWYQRSLDLTPVRPRFIGPIRNIGYEFVAEALSSRLEARVKQNSSLLSTLPSFLIIPRVRSLTAGFLERWLQSPALSGLARGLFSSTVEEMKNVDPPLQEDISAIDSILAMKLKANQFTIHVENITNVVKRIPTESISRHIFLHLLREELALLENIDIQSSTMTSTPMSILVHVYSSLSSNVAATALASALLGLLNAKEQSMRNEQTIEIRSPDIKTLLLLINKVSSNLGSKYNGYLFVNSILREHSSGMSSMNKRKMYENIQPDDIAQLVYECAILVVPIPPQISIGGSRPQQKMLMKKNEKQFSTLPEEEIAKTSSILLSIRKCILKWSLVTFLPFIDSIEDNDSMSIGGNEKTKKKSPKPLNQGVMIGAGEPNYNSVLDGEFEGSPTSISENQAVFLRSVRCLLFLVRPESEILMKFLKRNKDADCHTRGYLSPEQRFRINFCCDYGADIDNEVLQIILQKINHKNMQNHPELFLSLMEDLFYHCRHAEKAKLRINDYNIVWNMYELSVYRSESVSRNSCGNDFNGDISPLDHCTGGKRTRENLSKENEGNEDTPVEIPRLAHPGFWWRITSLVLIMGGLAPNSIGEYLWKEHPTIRSIVKMITSGRYRFPTVDCDEIEREKIKREENDLRSKEAIFTKILFLPKSQHRKKARIDNSPLPTQIGSRSSARQKAKQERKLAMQREQEIARELAEEQRIKKLLRSAQKTIMIWDPHCPARKPPKESVPLILSVARFFNLSELFRLCIDPDIVLQTIGSTSRDSIERAHDWLIPVVSTHSQVIDRLPPSASCFLLLRAYGSDKSQNSQLLELSSPLLTHVTNCLFGKYGEDGAQRAVDLLFVDLADSSPDRRRCARRVLQEATSKIESQLPMTSSLHVDEFAWLFIIMKVKYAKALMSIVISNISHALAYERGRVLCVYVLALKQYIDFAITNGVEIPWNFTNILCELLSIRPHVCCAAMDRYTDLQNLAIDAVHNGFETYISGENKHLEHYSAVEMKIFLKENKSKTCNDSNDEKPISVVIPLQLLMAAIALISNWTDDKGEHLMDNFCAHSNTQRKSDKPRETLLLLVDYLIPLRDNFSQSNVCFESGAASATFTQNGKRAVSVEQWVMLAKSRCEFIAKNAAYCTPEIFLPRLLLCCGLPKASFMSMLERLGKLGDESLDKHKCFTQLMSPSVTSEWGMGHSGKRGLLAWKLLGRISAYISTFGDNPSKINAVGGVVFGDIASSSFISWLIDEFNKKDKNTKSRTKKSSTISSNSKRKDVKRDHLNSQKALTSVLSNVLTDNISVDSQNSTSRKFSENETLVSIQYHCEKENPKLSHHDDSTTSQLLNELVKSESYELIESILEGKTLTLFSSKSHLNKQKQRDTSTSKSHLIATGLLRSFKEHSGKAQQISAVLLKWVPILTHFLPDSSFFEDLFKSDFQPNHKKVIEVLIIRCIQNWTSETIQSCQIWILTQVVNSTLDAYDLHFALSFILQSSGQTPSQKKVSPKAIKPSVFPAIRSQEHAKACVDLALECAKDEDFDNSASEVRGVSKCSYTRRNNLPDWLELLVVIGKCGKKYLALLTKTIVEKASQHNIQNTSVFHGTLLRMYVHFPSTMDLSDAKTRSILIHSVKTFSKEWVHWRTSLDRQICLSINCFASNPNQRQHQLLSDLSKRYPLLVVRDLHLFLETLRNDGNFSKEDKNRGRTNSETIPLNAKTPFGIVKIKVVHWGLCFTEQLWISVLDMMDSLPKEVLYSCGINMGLFDLYNLYLTLIGIQIEVGSTQNILRLKSKLSQSLSHFKTSSPSNFDNWMTKNLQGFEKNGTISSVLSIFNIPVGDSVGDNKN